MIKWNQVESSGNKWKQVESSGIKWKQVETSGNKWKHVNQQIYINSGWIFHHDLNPVESPGLECPSHSQVAATDAALRSGQSGRRAGGFLEATNKWMWVKMEDRCGTTDVSLV